MGNPWRLENPSRADDHTVCACSTACSSFTELPLFLPSFLPSLIPSSWRPVATLPEALGGATTSRYIMLCRRSIFLVFCRFYTDKVGPTAERSSGRTSDLVVGATLFDGGENTFTEEVGADNRESQPE